MYEYVVCGESAQGILENRALYLFIDSALRWHVEERIGARKGWGVWNSVKVLWSLKTYCRAIEKCCLAFQCARDGKPARRFRLKRMYPLQGNYLVNPTRFGGGVAQF